MRLYILKHKFIFLLFPVIIFLFLPYIQHDLVIGDDYAYHLARIESLADSIQSGLFPAKVHINWLNGYGYGSGFFYPDFFLYIPAFFRCIGLSLEISYKFFMLILFTALTLSTYISAKFIVKDSNIAVIGTFLISMSQQFLLNTFDRFALGEVLAFIFVPMIIAFWHDFVAEKFTHPLFFILGFGGLLLSHSITFLVSIILSLFFFLFHSYYLFRNYKLILRLFSNTLIILSASIFYWLPLLEQLANSRFLFMNPWISIEEETIRLIDLFGIARYSLGFPIIFILVIMLFYWILHENFKIVPYFNYLIAGLLLGLSTTVIPFWKLVHPVLNFIQFPWRLLNYAVCLISIAFTLFLKNIHLKRGEVTSTNVIAIYLIGTYLCCFYFGNLFIDTSIDWKLDLDSQNIYTQEYNLGAGYEWLPEGANISLYDTPDTVFTDDAQTTFSCQRTGKQLTFSLPRNNTVAYFDIPLIYYKGYRAIYTSTSGTVTQLKIAPSPTGQIIRAEALPNMDGSVTVVYSGTILQYISYFISLIVWIIIGVCYFFKKKK